MLKHREKRVTKLNEIHEQCSIFYFMITKLRHDIGDWRDKGIVRKSAAFKQAGLIAPKAYNTDSAVEGERLLAEYNLKDKSGRLVRRSVWRERPDVGTI